MKTTAEMIEVMAAHERGEVVECRYMEGNDSWTLLHSPSWNWVDCDYRIKPREPRVIWVNEYDDDSCLYAYESAGDADLNVMKRATRIAVKYIEVIK